MRVKIMYLVNGTTKNARFLCDAAATELMILTFNNGRDVNGPIDVFQAAHIQTIERRPSGPDDEKWLQSGILDSR